MSRQLPEDVEDWTKEDHAWARQFDWIMRANGLDPLDTSDEEKDDEKDEYDGMKGDDLRAELVTRGLSVEGKVGELRDRLRRDDNDELTDEDKASTS